MPTFVSHGVAAVAIGAAFPRSAVPARLWLAGAACAIAPDLDVLGFRFGIRYADFLGHRGFSHSLAFAALLATAVSVLALAASLTPAQRRAVWLYLFLATASHGVLDAFTNGGLGVAFFAPLDDTRYFFPVRPIRVSPLELDRFLSMRGVVVLASEIVCVWIPSAALVVCASWWRKRPVAR